MARAWGQDRHRLRGRTLHISQPCVPRPHHGSKHPNPGAGACCAQAWRAHRMRAPSAHAIPGPCCQACQSPSTSHTTPDPGSPGHHGPPGHHTLSSVHTVSKPPVRGNCWINTSPQWWSSGRRWLGRVPGGAELFLHSKVSPSRPGERAPADSGHRAVPRRPLIHRTPTAAGCPFTFSGTVSRRPC